MKTIRNDLQRQGGMPLLLLPQLHRSVIAEVGQGRNGERDFLTMTSIQYIYAPIIEHKFLLVN